jgi:hypothetical protein
MFSKATKLEGQQECPGGLQEIAACVQPMIGHMRPPLFGAAMPLTLTPEKYLCPEHSTTDLTEKVLAEVEALPIKVSYFSFGPMRRRRKARPTEFEVVVSCGADGAVHQVVFRGTCVA